VLLVTAYALAFFWAPNDADQGFIQKIFYLHVPLAITALIGFVAGGIYGIRYLRSGDRAHDLRSYVSIHMALIFGVGALITGSIWARASWGHWWLWDEPTLVSFLIVFLLYACYQPLRFSIEDPERQSRYAAVFSIVGGVFVPLNFAAVRSATQDIHPRTLSHADGLPFEVAVTFILALVGMATLFVALCKFELVQKTTRMRLKSLKRRLAGEDTFTFGGRSAAPREV
jgi:heme exporter protein C